MKKFLLLLFPVLVFCSCIKEKHSIRFKNEYSAEINNIMAGNTNIGTVGIGKVSEYIAIDPGDFKVTGITTASEPIEGEGKVSGKGKHQWTILCSYSKVITVVKDK
jgi:hypothetical protein